MARSEDRKKAIELRLQGKSYSEIRSALGLSKSTLSDWLKKYPLNPQQIEKLKEKIPARIERYKNTCATRRKNKELAIYQEMEKLWIPLSKRELYLAGIFLYWGEGTKVSSGTVSISNCDPTVIKFALFWLENCLEIPKETIKVLLHLYSDMSINEETNYWQKILGLPIENFRKPYIKTSTRAGLTYKGFGHGTCNIYILSTEIKSRIMQSLKLFSDYYPGLDIIATKDP